MKKEKVDRIAYNKDWYERNKERVKAKVKINTGGANGEQKYRNFQKSKCKQNANYKCEICGREGLDAHHILPVEQGGTDDLDNLICLCRSCHIMVHKGSIILNKDKTFTQLRLSYYRQKELDQERKDKEKEERMKEYEEKRKIIDKKHRYSEYKKELRKYCDYYKKELNDLETWHRLVVTLKCLYTLSEEEIELVLNYYRQK